MFSELEKQKRADVFFLQETHSDGDNAVDWAKEWEGLVICWRSVLSSEECALIKVYSAGVLSSDEDDPFPKVTIDPDLQDCQGPLLDRKEELSVDLRSVCRKLFYTACVKVFNRKRLETRSDTPWRDALGLADQATSPF
ncbi:hypothetical protein AOLI_G00320520 [Acnodon oligacanthus]